MRNEKLPPTHLLRIEVPLNMDDSALDYSPAKDAILIALSISRAAFAGHICDDPQVTLREIDDDAPHGP